MSPDVMELQTALQKEFKLPVFLFVLPTSYLLQFNDLRKVNVPLDFKKADIQKIIDTLLAEDKKTTPVAKKKVRKKKND